GVAGLKTVAGGLGVTAGAMLTAGSSLGWAFGIAGGILGAVTGIAGVVGKLRQKGQDQKDNARLRGGSYTDGSIEQISERQNMAPERETENDPKKRAENRQKKASMAAGQLSNLQVAQEIKVAMHNAGDDELQKARVVAQRARGFAEGERAPFDQTVALYLNEN